MGRRANPLSKALTRSSPEPLHRQLAALLDAAIRDGALKPGERLPSEGELAARYGVSRITLRQAVGALVGRQILVRKQGKGTFVTAPTVRHDLGRLHGLFGSLFSQAEGASARVLRYELRRPPADIAELMRLRPGADALSFQRLYLIGAEPIATTDTWLAPEVVAVPRAKAELISTEDMMIAVGIRIASTQVALRAVAAGARIGKLLKLSARAPVLELRRSALAADGAVKQTGCFWLCSDRYQLVRATASGSAAEDLFDLRHVEQSP
jgi:GntR family transcriptional regulator